MRYAFRRKLRHPFYPELKLTPAAPARDCPALCDVLENLLDAAAAGVRVHRAIFPIRLPSSPFLSHHERDLLWNLFRVPVYTLLLDTEGGLIACECEAQDGMHLTQAADLPGAARLETAPCDCGRPGSRILVNPCAPAARRNPAQSDPGFTKWPLVC